MAELIELRSDTFTLPDEGMRDAMFNAEVGDDVFGEDPSVNALEEKAAMIFAKEDALFCPSGTMCNQIAVKVNSRPPGELICETTSHVYQYEGGGVASNSGLSVCLVEGVNGLLTVDQVEAAINDDDIHKAETQILVLENSHNRGGGSCYELAAMQRIKALCENRELKVHLDGARIFNAIAAKKYSSEEIGACFDTVSVCLSKGLGAPVGSVLISDNETIRKARRIRKVFGGGMRQAGYIAAAGLYALDNNVERLTDDHRNAIQLASTINELSWVSKVLPVQTNIIVFELKDHGDVEQKLVEMKENGILAVAFGLGKIRMVTHLGIAEEKISLAEKILRNI